MNPAEASGPIRVVLADANVLYSRVLRDFLLYSASAGAYDVAWSSQILADMVEHLVTNRPSFGQAAADALLEGMASAFPFALVDPGLEHFARLERYVLPDEDDREVFAAALAAEADVICTSNIKHFPSSVATELGLRILAPDDLLSYVAEYQPLKLVAALRKSVDRLRGATTESTLAALRKAQASKTADALAMIINFDGSNQHQ